MIVETAKWAEKDLPGVLDTVKPDVICVDNVILFPAIKRYAKQNRQALGADHLMLGERDRGSRYSAASFGLRREGQEGLHALPQAFQRGDQADP